MRTRSPDVESVYTGNNRSEVDDEQSYYTHYSAGSMGLAKRANKKLSLVSYVALDEDSDLSERREHTPLPESVEGEEEYTEALPVSNGEAIMPATNKSTGTVRRSFKTFQDYKQAASNSDPSFDHSSSTHKARGNTGYASPMVSSSTSSSSHWRRAKPELAVITDVRDEEDASEAGEIPMGKGKPVAEDLNDPTSPDSANGLDGAETRSRRRERLTRLARIKSPVRKQGDGSVSPAIKQEISPSPKNDEKLQKRVETTRPDKALSPRDRVESREDYRPQRTLSPEQRVAPVEKALSPNNRNGRHGSERPQSHPSQYNKADSSQKTLGLDSNNPTSPLRGANVPSPRTNPSSPRGVNLPSPTRITSPSSRKTDDDDHVSLNNSGSDFGQWHHQRISERVLSPNKNFDEWLERAVTSSKTKDVSRQDQSSPQKSSSKRGSGLVSSLKSPREPVSSPRKFFPETVEDEMEESDPKAFMDKFLQKYHNKKKHGKTHKELEVKNETREMIEPKYQPAVSSHLLGRQWPAGTTIVGGGLTPVREESRTTASSAARSSDTLSDNSSVRTSHFQQVHPCISQFVQNTSFIAKGPDGTGCIGYTQKCTSFVSGVWQSCTRIGGYQTESKKSLLQLEMIAEQSVSTIFHQSAAGRQSPEAFRHSRELLAKVESIDETKPQLQEVRSDEATTNDDHLINQSLGDASFGGGWNVEEALSTIGAKVQEAVGMNENRKRDEQSMMDDMRHMIDSLSAYYIAPHHQPYYGEDSVRGRNVFEYRHGVTGGGSDMHAMFVSEQSSTDDDEGRITDQSSKQATNTMSSCDTYNQDSDDLGPTSIYSSVARKSKDRRGMVMELQKRRMKQVKRKEEWGNPQKIEEETARLRRVYLGLYDKIHQESFKLKDNPQNERNNNNHTMQIEEVEDYPEEEGPHEERVQAVQEATRGENDNDAASENMDDDDDYAVVWAASETSGLSPRHVPYPYQTESLVDHSSHDDEHNDYEEEDETPELGRLTEENSVPESSSDEAGQHQEQHQQRQFHHVSSRNEEQGSMEESNPSMDQQDKFYPTMADGEKSLSTSTRYLDAVEYHTSIPSDEFGGGYQGNGGLEDDISRDGQRYHVAHPDPTFSSGDEDTIDRDRCAPLISSDTTTTCEEDPLVLPTVTTGTTTTTSEMDELVSSFLEGNLSSLGNKGRSPVGMSDLRDLDGNSESSRPMVLLTQDMFNTVHSNEYRALGNLHEEEDEDNDGEDHGDGHDMMMMNNIHSQDCGFSIHSDPTLADSTMMSGYSGSNHTNDLSLAETIVSIGGVHSRSSHRTLGSGGTGSDVSSHDGTPEPSEVPPEIAQPLGPISEYQVLYQISEEDEEGASEPSDENSTTDEEDQSCNGTFARQNDVPFDEDVTLEDYQRRHSRGRRMVSSLLRWTAMIMGMYYLGVVDWIVDGSISIPALTMGRNFLESSDWYNRMIQPMVDAATTMQDMRVTSSSSSSSNRAEDPVVSHPPGRIMSSPSSSSTLPLETPATASTTTTTMTSLFPSPDLYLYDGITIVQEWNGEFVCQSLAFVTADAIPESPSEAYRRSWVLELQEALLNFN